MASRRHSPGINKRELLQGAAGAALMLTQASRAQEANSFDLIVIGGGNAGMPAAIFAAQRGARVLILEAADRLGGTLLFSGGKMSAAGTQLQKSKGIDDSPDLHFENVMEMSEGTANPELLRVFVDAAAPAFDWLMEQGFNVEEGTPVARGTVHERQNRARYVWSPDRGLGILRVLDAAIAPLIAQGQIAVELNTSVEALDFDDDGAVVAVSARHQDGMPRSYSGSQVLLASGGYASNSEMFEALEGVPDYSDVSNPHSQGIGITLGLAAGGFLRGGENHLPTFGSILAEDRIPSRGLAGIHHYPPDRQPWEIWVNRDGKRFLREDIVSIHKKEVALAEQPEERFWVVFDEAMLNSAPPVVQRWSRDELKDAFSLEFAFVQADSLEALADRAGISVEPFLATVDHFNRGQAAGKDALGRKHMPLPIRDKPFYAIRVQSSQLIGFAGLAVDDRLRVLRENGTSVPNLYAAGEVLGAGQLMGKCYFGGMMVTPALALGRLLGKETIPFG